MNDVFLQLKSITKRYASKLAVDQVSLDIPKGCIYGLLGPNGAGKTSIIRMITSITAPDSGEIIFNGESLGNVHNTRIGYMPEERGLYKKMRVFEQLVYLLRLKDLSKADAKETVNFWLKKLDIADWAQKEIGELSKGMQQKIQFIATVAHHPTLLILDEPFSGLDPINTQMIEDEIRELQEKGTTIIFSTHRMEQVEELCERIALINNGKVVLEDDLQSARKKFQKKVYFIQFAGSSDLIKQIPGVEIVELNPSNALLKLNEGITSKAFLHSLINLDLDLLKFELHLPKLQEIFIEVVQNNPVHA